MNVVETVAEGETAATHATLTPMHSASHAARPAATPYVLSSPAPSAPSTPPPVMLQQATIAPVSPAASLPSSATKILPSMSVSPSPEGQLSCHVHDASAEPTVITRPITPNVTGTTISHTEKEQIAMQWLRANFEPVVGAPSIEQNVLYRQYTAGCARNGPAKQVLGLVQFFSCVR